MAPGTHTSNGKTEQHGGIIFVDIGVNLTDTMYAGTYHGKKAHVPDLDAVLSRARDAGVGAQIVTSGSVQDVGEALALTRQYDDLYATAGVHPTRSSQVTTTYLDDLRRVLDMSSITRHTEGRIVAIGECGLDYDRLHFSDAKTQKDLFAAQLVLACEYRLPLFLHCRAAQADFLAIIGGHVDAIAQACATEASQQDARRRRRVGVAHCFTGSVAEMRELVAAGLFVGLTGCSFKGEEGIEVARQIPLDHLLLETDAPWCDMRPTHASTPLLADFAKTHPQLAKAYMPDAVKKEKWVAGKAIKGRNEPCTMGAVAAVVAQAKALDIFTVAHTVQENTRFLFGI